MIETKTFSAETKPTGFLWWMRSGDNWSAPTYNNGSTYLPNISNQILRNIIWWFRNPIGGFVGFVVGLSGVNRSVTGTAPVDLVTWRDARPPRTGWKWAITNRWAPFVSYWGGHVEFYWGWRPHDGALGFKLVWRQSAFSDQPISS